MNLESYIKTGQKVDITYERGVKKLGNFEISAVFQSTLQCKSLDTGSTLYFPNPLAPNIGCVVGSVEGGLNVLIMEEVEDTEEATIKPVYTYHFKD